MAAFSQRFSFTFTPHTPHAVIDQRVSSLLPPTSQHEHALSQLVQQIKLSAVHLSDDVPANAQFYEQYLGDDTTSVSSMAVLDYPVAMVVARIILLTNPHANYTHENNPIRKMILYAATHMPAESPDFTLWALQFAVTHQNVSPEWINFILTAIHLVNMPAAYYMHVIHLVLVTNTKQLPDHDPIIVVMAQMTMRMETRAIDLSPAHDLWFDTGDVDMLAVLATLGARRVVSHPNLIARAIYLETKTVRAYFNKPPIRINTLQSSYHILLAAQVSRHRNIDIYNLLLEDNAIAPEICVALTLQQTHPPTLHAIIRNAVHSHTGIRATYITQLTTRTLDATVTNRVYTAKNTAILFAGILPSHPPTVIRAIVMASIAAFLSSCDVEYLHLFPQFAIKLDFAAKLAASQTLLSNMHQNQIVANAAQCFMY